MKIFQKILGKSNKTKSKKQKAQAEESNQHSVDLSNQSLKFKGNTSQAELNITYQDSSTMDVTQLIESSTK